MAPANGLSFCAEAKRGNTIMSNEIPDVSVIIPTYNEAENIPVIIPKIYKVLKKAQISREIIVIDDSSPDNTAAIALDLATKYPVNVVIRTKDRGLSSSVIEGFKNSKGKVCVVMDADGSHPVESLPDMVQPLLENRAEIAVGSRRIAGGAISNWHIHRHLISKTASLMAKPLTKMSDPTSGYMAIKRELLDGLYLNPIGWKIVLETVVKLNSKRMIEVPIAFEDRRLGQSKMSFVEQCNYLRHLYRLYMYHFPNITEVVKFCIIGLTGVFVDMSVVIFLKEFFRLHILMCAVCGFVVAITSNYIFNRYWTFAHTRKSSFLNTYLKFVSVSCIGLSVRLLTMYGFIKYAPMDYEYSYIINNFIGIIAGTAVNFIGSKFFVFISAGLDSFAGKVQKVKKS